MQNQAGQLNILLTHAWDNASWLENMLKRKSTRIRQRNLPQADRIEPPDYYFWGTVPVRFLPTKKGGMTSERLDLKTGEFVKDQGMVAEIFFKPFTSTNIERIGEMAFNKRVEQIRKDIKGTLDGV